MLILLATTGFTFGVLVVVFRPLELVFPAKPGQRFFRPGFLTDLCFFLGRHLFWAGMVFWLLLQVRSWVFSIVTPDFHEAVAQQPWWLQAVEAVFLSDLFMYWGHRLQHRVPFLWRFHAVHHSSQHMDWLAGHREHPFDSIYTMTLINLPPWSLDFLCKRLPASWPCAACGRRTSIPMFVCRLGRCGGSSAPRNCTTGTITGTVMSATTAICRRSWISCSAPITARTTNQSASASRNRRREHIGAT